MPQWLNKFSVGPAVNSGPPSLERSSGTPKAAENDRRWRISPAAPAGLEPAAELNNSNQPERQSPTKVKGNGVHRVERSLQKLFQMELMVVLAELKVRLCYSLRIVLLFPECPSTFLANTLLRVPAVPCRNSLMGCVEILRRDPYREAPLPVSSGKLCIGSWRNG